MPPPSAAVAPPLPDSSPRGLRGATIGTLIGCSAWVVALAVVCLANGRTDALVPVVLPMLLASLGLGMLVMASLQLVRSLPVTVQAAARGTLFFGGLCVVLGVLLLLVEGFVTPLLSADPSLTHNVRAVGGLLTLPRAVPIALLIAGVALSMIGVRRLSRLR